MQSTRATGGRGGGKGGTDSLLSCHDGDDDEEDLGPSIDINMECVVEEK